MKRVRVGILTWHYFLNFGSALQAYALKRTVEDLGYSVEIINYRMPKHGLPNYSKDRFKIIVSKLLERRGYICGRQVTYPFLRFHFDYLKLRKASFSQDWLRRKCSQMDCVICGSDQIWAPIVVDPVYLLETVPDDVVKVSYAASIGLDYIPDDKVELYRQALQRFDAVSVREETGRRLLEEKCSIRASVVLDPTLLLSGEQWERLERKPEELKICNERYYFCYFLNAENTYRDSVLKALSDKKYEIVGYSLKVDDHTWMNDVTGKIGPREFLWLVHHAEGVITDSFHGTIFSLLYHKPFACLLRFTKESPICQNSRLQQLNNYFNIDRRIFETDKELYIGAVDYEDFESKLNEHRVMSVGFLREALGGLY